MEVKSSDSSDEIAKDSVEGVENNGSFVEETVNVKSNETVNEKREIRKKIITLALPSVGENLLQTIFSLVDMMFIGRLGTAALAGAGLANQVNFIIVSLIAALSIGTAVVIAQNIGASNEKAAKDAAFQSIYLSLILSSILFVLAIFFSRRLFYLFDAEPDVIRYAGDYLYWITVPSFFFVPTFIFGSIFRGSGDTKTPFYVMMVTNSLNIFLDYALIFGRFGFPRLEVAGAAIATSASRAVAVVIYSYIIFSGKREFSLPFKFPKFKLDVVRKIIDVGFPTSLERLSHSVGNLFFASVVLSLGTAALAAHRITINIDSISMNIGLGFMTATTTLVGINVGNSDIEGAKKTTYEAVKIAAIIMGLVGVVMICFPDIFIRLFTDDVDVVMRARSAVRIIGCIQPLLATSNIFQGALRGGGNVKTPLISTTIGMWLFRVPLSYIFVNFIDLGLGSVWIAMAIDIGFRAIFLFFNFRNRTDFKKYIIQE